MKGCRINNCSKPHYARELCDFHWQRDRTGRMDKDGLLLPVPVKIKECERCGISFKLKDRERHIRWCSDCRPLEYLLIQKENNAGTYRRGKNNTHTRKKYIKFVLNKIIKSAEVLARNRKILDLRTTGNTYVAIAKEIGCSNQNVHGICSKYK